MSAIPDRVCAQCGKTYTPTRVRARFCSLACKHAWWNDRRRERRQAQPLEPRKCAHCGREFAPRDGRQRFCSPRCQHLAWELARGQAVGDVRSAFFELNMTVEQRAYARELAIERRAAR